MKLHTILPTAALALALAACGSSTATAPAASTAAASSAADVKAGAISISSPWARASQMSGGMGSMATAEAGGMGSMATAEAGGMGDMDGGMGAAYMVIANSGSAADKLVSVSTDAAKTAEVHNVIEENGVMSMRPVEGGLEIPAGGSVTLKPGSYHLMLIGLTKPLVAGESITLKLTFATAGEVTVTAPIREK
ncbi:copper chaperone PCu(A)C [Chloroflexia bacterium SDU3-3]|nr:copper chaperone PCu(A)C [Chloroflexia bacterium SDU3-3]